MKPLLRIPSLGTVHAGPSRFTVVILMLLPWVLIIPMVVLSPYAVILRAAWFKQPARYWRTASAISVVLAIVFALLCSPLLIPEGMPITFPQDDPFFGPPQPGLIGCIITVNALLVAGFALLPLALISSIDTYRES